MINAPNGLNPELQQQIIQVTEQAFDAALQANPHFVVQAMLDAGIQPLMIVNGQQLLAQGQIVEAHNPENEHTVLQSSMNRARP